MGKKKTTQSTVKGRAGGKGKMKSKHIDVDESYLSPQSMTSDAMDTMQGNLLASPLPQSNVISMLHRIERSNKDLIQRVEKMEKQNASVTSSSCPVTGPRRGVNSYLGGPARQQGHPKAVDPTGWRKQAQGVGKDVAGGQLAGPSFRPPPTLEAVRASSDVFKAVTRLLAYYDDQVEMEVLQGKGPFGCRKSGRYNVTDTMNVKPELKWPNEGYITNSSVKKPAYDDMNMTQWVA